MLVVVFVLSFFVCDCNLFGLQKHDVFVGGGMSIGQSRLVTEDANNLGFAFTDKRRLPSKDINIQTYPFPNDKIGLTYTYQWNNPLLLEGVKLAGIPTTSLDRKWQMHSGGVNYRFLSKRIQPTVGAGVSFYSEDYRRRIFVLGFTFLLPPQHYGTEAIWVSFGVKLPVGFNFFIEPNTTVLISPINSFSSISLRVLYNFKMPFSK